MRVAGQLHVVRGARLVESPRMGQFTRQRRGRRESLFVLVEPVGGHADETCRQVLRALEQEFRANQRSLTSALLQGLRSAHQRLRDENRRALLEHQVGAIVTAALVSGDRAYLVLTGGATAVLYHRGAAEILCAGDVRPLGFEVEPALDLREVVGTPGDGLLLTSSPITPGVEPDDLAEILALDDRAALDQLRSLADPNSTFSAVLLRHSLPLVEPASLPASRQSAVESRESAVESRQSRVGSRQSETSAPFSEPADAAAAPERRAPPGQSVRRGAGAPRLGGAALTALFRIFGSRMRGRVAGRPPTGKTPSGGEGGGDVRPARAPRRTASARNPAASAPRRPGFSVESLRVALLLAVVFSVIVLVAALAWIVPQQARAQIEATAVRSVEQAEQTRLKALLENDRDRQRSLLKEADRLARSALAVRGAERKASTVIETVSADLARLDAVHSLADLQIVAAPSAFTGGVKDLRLIVAAADALFALADGRIHRFPLTADGRTLAEPASTAVAAPGEANRLAWLTWAPAGGARQQDGLVGVDEQRNLWEWSSGEGLRRLALRGADAWSSFRSIRSYGGNLYVLDGAGSQVLRYLPTQAGYDSESRGILEAASIADAVDLAVDGNVFVLTAAGKVWKFVGGRGEPLSMAGLDRPLKEPGMVFATSATKHVYVADTGNRRIVVLDKAGRFVRQLAADFPVRALHVDELAGRLYVAGPTAVYVTTLPQ